MFVREENKNSYKYKAENQIKIIKSFLATEEIFFTDRNPACINR